MSETPRTHPKHHLSPRSSSRRFEPWEKWFGWSRSGTSWTSPSAVTSSSDAAASSAASGPSGSGNPSAAPGIDEVVSGSNPVLALLGLPEWYLAMLGASSAQVADLVPRSDQAAADLLARVKATVLESHSLTREDAAAVSNMLLALLVCINQSLIWVTRESAPTSLGYTEMAAPPSVSLSDAFDLARGLLDDGSGSSTLPLQLRLAAAELLMSSIKLDDARQAAKSVFTVSSPPSDSRLDSTSPSNSLSRTERRSFYLRVLSLLLPSEPQTQEELVESNANSDSGAPSGEPHPLSPSASGAQENASGQDGEGAVPQPVVRSIQVRSLLVLSKEGREVGPFPDLLKPLRSFFIETWTGLSRSRSSLEYSDTVPALDHALRYDPIVQEERTFASLLELFASIVKFNFARVPLAAVQDTLQAVCTVLSPRPSRSSSQESLRAIQASPDASSAEAVPQASLSIPAMRKERGSWGAYSSHSSTIEQNSSRGTPVLGPSVAPATSPTIRKRQSAGILSRAGAPNAVPATPAGSSGAKATTRLWRPREAHLILTLFDTIMAYGVLPPATVSLVALCLCRCLGQSTLSLDDNASLTAWVFEVEDRLLATHYGNLTLRAVVGELASMKSMGKDTSPELPLATGGLRYLIHAVQFVDQHAHDSTLPVPTTASGSKPRTANILVSLGLIAPALKTLASLGEPALDMEMISFYRSILPTEAMVPGEGSREVSEGKWVAHADLRNLAPTTMADWDIVLQLFLLTNKRVQDLRQSYSVGTTSNDQGIPSAAPLAASSKQTKWLAPKVQANSEHPVVEAFLDLVSDCRFSIDLSSAFPSVPTSIPPVATVSNGSDKRVPKYTIPWSQGWADLLLNLLWSFPDADAERIVRYYHAHELVLPCFPHWIDHLKALVSALINRTGPSPRPVGSDPAPKARALLIELLFDRVYPAVVDFVEFHTPLMTEVIVPLAEQALMGDPDDHLVPKLLNTLVDSGARMGMIATVASDRSAGLEAQPSDPHSGDEVPDPPSASSQGGHLFTVIRLLLNQVVRQAKGPKEGRYVFCLHSNNHAEVPITVHAVLALIAIFNSIAFTAPWKPAVPSRPAGSGAEPAGQPESKQTLATRGHAIALFRNIVDIIRGTAVQSEATSGARWGKAPLEPRLVALQWALRLRTDSQHRLFIVQDIDEFIEPHAQLIGRDRAVHIDLDDPVPRVGRSSERGWEDPPSSVGRDESRGRSRTEGSTARTREGSRVRVKPTSEFDKDRTRLHWHLPQRIHFEPPPGGARSQVIKTYRSVSSLDTADEAGHDAFDEEPLPTSALLAAYLYILQSEEDWDLVSYVMAHLPHQLTNRYLFCGPKSDEELRRLGVLLVSHLPPENKLVTQAQLPWEIKRVDVTAIGYAAVQALVGYRALFAPPQQDEMVLAFVHGLSLAESAALACAKGLALCALQLPQSFTAVLSTTLVALQQATPTLAMSAPILELLILIAHSPIAYRALGEEEYKRVFSIALQFVTSRQPADQDQDDSPARRTLSCYVAMQAHYAITLFFNRIEPSERIKYTSFITEQLLAAKGGEECVDDQTLVLLDYITRATFANSRPYPTRSFINTTLFGSVSALDQRAGGVAQYTGQDDKTVTKTYVYPHSVITISALQRRRWCEVIIRRPSGTISFLLKVENEDSDLALRDPEFQDTPELLLANRSGGDRSIYHAPPLPSLPGRADSQGRPRRLSLDGQPSPMGSSSFVPVHTASHLFIPPYKTSEDDKNLTKAKSKDATGKETSSRSKDKEGYLAISPYEPRPAGEIDNVHKVIQDVLEPTPHGADAESKRVAVNLVSHRVLDPAFIEMSMTGYPDVDLKKLPVAVTPSNSTAVSAMARLDTAPVVDYKSIVVLFMGPGQVTPDEILGNSYGSPPYARFVARMGSELVQLDTPEARTKYTGGLNAHDHGRHMYMWQDEITQVFFHVPTMMPNLPSRPHFANKLSLVRHDLVHIVWNESGQEYPFGLLSSRYSKYSVNIVISPDARGGAELASVCLERGTKYYRVMLQRAQGMPSFSPVGDGIVISEDELPTFVRTLAINAHLMATIFMYACRGETFQSNWATRLAIIQKLYQRVEKARSQGPQPTGKWAVYEAMATHFG